MSQISLRYQWTAAAKSVDQLLPLHTSHAAFPSAKFPD